MSVVNDLIPFLIDFQERHALDIRKKDDVASFLKDLRQPELSQFVTSTPDVEWASFIDENFGLKESTPNQIASIIEEDEGFVPEVHAKSLTPATIYLKDGFDRAMNIYISGSEAPYVGPRGTTPPIDEIEEIASRYKGDPIVADHVSLMKSRHVLRVGIGKKTGAKFTRAWSFVTKDPDPMFWKIEHSRPGINTSDPSHTAYNIERQFEHILTIRVDNIARIERR
jgi:hypothetical protein